MSRSYLPDLLNTTRHANSWFRQDNDLEDVEYPDPTGVEDYYYEDETPEDIGDFYYYDDNDQRRSFTGDDCIRLLKSACVLRVRAAKSEIFLEKIFR